MEIILKKIYDISLGCLAISQSGEIFIVTNETVNEYFMGDLEFYSIESKHSFEDIKDQWIKNRFEILIL